MKSDFPTNKTIRQYLLGKLDEQSDLETRLSEQMLFDDELSEIVDSTEDEIIEDYLDGALNATDRAAIEQYFLRPAERREKLQLALLLRSHFETTADALAKKKLAAPHKSTSKTDNRNGHAPAFPWFFQVRAWSELAALVLLVAASLIYVSAVRHRLHSELTASRQAQTQLEAELAQERERSASLTKQLQEVRPAVATLAFLGPVLRSEGDSPVIDIGPWTQRIHVELDLRGASPGAYDVRLVNAAGRTLWAQSEATTDSSGLRFEMPAQSLSTGLYCLKVGSRSKSYCFRVRGKQ